MLGGRPVVTRLVDHGLRDGVMRKRPAWLNDARRDLDAAVALAYGWPVDLSNEDALARLLELNQARAVAQERRPMSICSVANNEHYCFRFLAIRNPLQTALPSKRSPRRNASVGVLALRKTRACEPASCEAS